MWLRLFLSVVTGLMVVLTWAVASGGADDQDACRIGAVSSEEYRTIAAEIAALPVVDWQNVHDDSLGVSEGLEDRVAAAIRDRIHAVIAARESSDQKVAAMQAVLRSIGAEFARADLIYSYKRPDLHRVSLVVYHYRIDVNRLGVLRPLFRWGRIDLVLTTDESWQTIGDLHQVAFHIAVPFSPSISGLKKGSSPDTRVPVGTGGGGALRTSTRARRKRDASARAAAKPGNPAPGHSRAPRR
jgi:hypothetical protein